MQPPAAKMRRVQGPLKKSRGGSLRTHCLPGPRVSPGTAPDSQRRDKKGPISRKVAVLNWFVTTRTE